MWLSLHINNHQSHQCDYLSHFDINGKGSFSSWGCSPCLNSPWGYSPYLNAFDLPLNNVSPFLTRDITLIFLMLPLWPSLPVWASKRHTNITHYHTFFTYASIISLIIHHHVTSFSLLFTINRSHLYFPNIIYF